MTDEALGLESAWRLAGMDGEGQEQVAVEDVDRCAAAMPEPPSVEARTDHDRSCSICSAASSPLRTPSSWKP